MFKNLNNQMMKTVFAFFETGRVFDKVGQIINANNDKTGNYLSR